MDQSTPGQSVFDGGGPGDSIIPYLTPLQRDKHICVLPQGMVESPSGQINQLKICWLLSTRPLVVFPIGLNGGDQSVTVDLPESLHTGSSVTTDEHPYIKVNIPMLIPEEQDHVNPPLGKKGDIPTINRPKLPENLGSLSWQR